MSQLSKTDAKEDCLNFQAIMSTCTRLSKKTHGLYWFLDTESKNKKYLQICFSESCVQIPLPDLKGILFINIGI